EVKEIRVVKDWRRGGENTDVDFLFVLGETIKEIVVVNVTLSSSCCFRAWDTQRDGHRNVHDVVPYMESRATRQFEGALVVCLERFDDIEGLALENGHLPAEHSFFEICIEGEEGTELRLRFGPPF